MASTEAIVTSILSHRQTIQQRVFWAQLIVGIVLIALGYYMGKDHMLLILLGNRAQGQIVEYKQEYIQRSRANGTYTLTFMPIVEYHLGEKAVRFEDWKGSSIAAGLNTTVTVLYLHAHPASAMIDRPVWNWMPWAPICTVGLLFLLAGFKGAVDAAKA
jgi:hypothetical protein